METGSPAKVSAVDVAKVGQVPETVGSIVGDPPLLLMPELPPELVPLDEELELPELEPNPDEPPEELKPDEPVPLLEVPELLGLPPFDEPPPELELPELELPELPPPLEPPPPFEPPPASSPKMLVDDDGFEPHAAATQSAKPEQSETRARFIANLHEPVPHMCGVGR
jgi:hypothetical protein